MDDYLTRAGAGPSGFDPPPILIAGDSDESLDRAARTIEACGLRIADRVRIEAAPERIDRQIAASPCGSSSKSTAGRRWTGCLNG
jgi:hypothetical protein